MSGDLYKNKKPSELTAEDIAAIRDKNSTKANMGEGKVDVIGGAVNAGKQLYNSVKQIVNDSMTKTIEVKKDNDNRVKTIKQPKPRANPSEILRKKK
jgi:hypothetical protein